MKKFFVSVLGIIFLLFGLSGCGAKSIYNSDYDDIDLKEKISVGINEVAVYKGVNYTVTNVEYSNGDEWYQPSDGNEYVIITIKIENNSDEKISYNTYDWQMINSQGQEDSATFTIIDTDTNLSSGDLIAGGTKEGTIIFEEPKDDASLKLVFYENLLLDDEPNIEIIIK